MHTLEQAGRATTRIGLVVGAKNACFGLGTQRVVSMKKNEDKTTTVVDVEVTTQSERLSASEERILRMRSGATLKKGERLESKLDGVAAEHMSEVLAKLALIEAAAIEAIEEDPNLRTDKKQRIVEALQNLDD